MLNVTGHSYLEHYLTRQRILEYGFPMRKHGKIPERGIDEENQRLALLLVLRSICRLPFNFLPQYYIVLYTS